MTSVSSQPHILDMYDPELKTEATPMSSLSLGASIVDLLNATFTFSNCSTVVLCASSKNSGSCNIEYGHDPSYQDLSPPIQTPLNSLLTLPFMTPSTYYYVVTVTINSSLTFQIRGSFNSGDGCMSFQALSFYN